MLVPSTGLLPGHRGFAAKHQCLMTYIIMGKFQFFFLVGNLHDL